jgi:hypothetical protein
MGASCALCGDRRRDNLRSIELLGSWLPSCHNCAARIIGLQPMPQTIGEIRRALLRDRRFRARRLGKSDTRVFQRNRRSDDRRRVRALGPDDAMIIDDEMIMDMEELADELSGVTDHDDLTRIRELPLRG